MTMQRSSRELVKGHLQFPTPTPFPKSYTQPPPSSKEVAIKRLHKQKEVVKGLCDFCMIHVYFLLILSVVEFSSRDIPQPFLDPSIIKRRVLERAKGMGR